MCICAAVSKLMHKGHTLQERILTYVCVFFVFVFCVFLGGGGFKCIFACAHVWMFVFMHVDACSSWESNLKLDPAGRLSW